MNSSEKISLGSELFHEMREGFDVVLNQLLVKMGERREDVGEITLKLKVELKQVEVEEFSEMEDCDSREAIVPRFTHIIQSVVQEKHRLMGATLENCEMVWDDVNKKWELQPLREAQMSFYEEEG